MISKYMKTIIGYCLLAVALVTGAGCSKKSSGGGGTAEPKPPEDKNWKFATTPMWSDEFDNTGLPDATKWNYDVGGGGWGNNELQYYTNANLNNAKVENGKLYITARKESSNGMNYTSARLVTRNKGDFSYGRVEVKAKLPTGKGTWPAIWMLPTDYAYGNWPNSGEIDIMEHVGYDPGNVHFSIHTQSYNWPANTQKTATKLIATAVSDFHVYRMDWTPYAIRGYYDDQLIFTFVNEGKGSATWPFDKKFHLLLNLAVGGNWGGAQGMDDTIWPATMEVDYVRVYKMIE
jgi:beta-glucanase (GH16 family)